MIPVPTADRNVGERISSGSIVLKPDSNSRLYNALDRC